MARTRTTGENVKNENVTGAEATEPAENSAGEAESAGDASGIAEDKFNVASAKAEEERVTVVMPRYLFTSDPYAEHHDVVDNGKIYQVKYDEPVQVPVSVANIIKDAIAQKKKVKALVDSLNGKAKEIAE